MARIASATHSRFSCSGTERHSKQSETYWATVALKAHPYICGWLQETCVRFRFLFLIENRPRVKEQSDDRGIVFIRNRCCTPEIRRNEKSVGTAVQFRNARASVPGSPARQRRICRPERHRLQRLVQR